MCFQRPRRKEENSISHFDVQLIDTSSRLPEDFAIRLLEREMHLERTFEQSTVEDLILLYSTAIEYYNTKEDDQALNYQLRMQKMLKRPEVLKIYSIQRPQKRPSISIPTESTVDHQQDTEDPEFIMQEIETPRSIQAQEAVKDKELSDKILGDKLADSLKSQENDLETRIKRRKLTRTMSNMSFVYSPVSEVESPRLATEDSNIENELEGLMQELMEKSYEEKSMKIAEITVKYNTEISAMEDSGVMGIVVAQMRQNMAEEIEQVSKEFDEKRRAEVKGLRDSFAVKSKFTTP